MKYLYLLYADESKMAAPGSPQFEAQNDAFNQYYDVLLGAGMFAGGDPIKPSATAQTVRVRDGATKTTAGPVGGGTEQLVGFYLVEAKDDAEAAAYAAKCPAAFVGAVEVRGIAQA
jgi:hypothetical protein